MDEIAAEHCHADCILHFGHSCLSPTTGRYPVFFIHDPRSPSQNWMELFKERISSLSHAFLVFWDPSYQPYEKSIKACIEACSKQTLLYAGVYLPDMVLEEVAESTECIYIGSSSSPSLTRLCLCLGNQITVSLFDPEDGSFTIQSPSVNKLLSRRYFQIQKAKDAERIGIVVGTLGIGMYLFSKEVAKDEKSVLGRAVLDFYQRWITE